MMELDYKQQYRKLFEEFCPGLLKTTDEFIAVFGRPTRFALYCDAYDSTDVIYGEGKAW